MEVEVSIQDRFFTASRLVASETEYIAISPETWEHWFGCWIEALQSTLPPAGSYEVCLRLTEDIEIQTLNAQYRHKDQPTDVLAFAALEVDSPQLPTHLQSSIPLYLGDVVISVETAYRQAQQQGHPLQIELAWLATHGLLHLLGWDHPDEESLREMLNQQEILLQAVELPIKK